MQNTRNFLIYIVNLCKSHLQTKVIDFALFTITIATIFEWSIFIEETKKIFFRRHLTI